MTSRARTPGCVLLLTVPVLLGGCAIPLGDEVTPAERALEIIVMGDGSGPDDCYVSYDEMVAGTHSVSVGVEQGTARARIVSASGEVVFEADARGPSAEGSDDEPEVVAADALQHEVTLEPGDYQVECAKGSSMSSASLHVTATSSSE